MAINFDDWKAKAIEERVKPIIILVNEGIVGTAGACAAKDEKVERAFIADAVRDILNNLQTNSIHGIVTVLSFGDGVNLRFGPARVGNINGVGIRALYEEIKSEGFSEYEAALNAIIVASKAQESHMQLLEKNEVWKRLYEKKKLNPWPISKESVFGSSLLLTREIINDTDYTPKDIYNPAVILVTTKGLSEGWKEIEEKVFADTLLTSADRFSIRGDLTTRLTRATINKGFDDVDEDSKLRMFSEAAKTNNGSWMAREWSGNNWSEWDEERLEIASSGNISFGATDRVIYFNGIDGTAANGKINELSTLINQMIGSFSYSPVEREFTVAVSPESPSDVPLEDDVFKGNDVDENSNF